MALNQVDISMMQDIPAPGPAGKIIISDGADWTSGENAPVGSIVKQATDPTPTDPATPSVGDMILNNGCRKIRNFSLFNHPSWKQSKLHTTFISLPRNKVH